MYTISDALSDIKNHRDISPFMPGNKEIMDLLKETGLIIWIGGNVGWTITGTAMQLLEHFPSSPKS